MFNLFKKTEPETKNQPVVNAEPLNAVTEDATTLSPEQSDIISESKQIELDFNSYENKQSVEMFIEQAVTDMTREKTQYYNDIQDRLTEDRHSLLGKALEQDSNTIDQILSDNTDNLLAVADINLMDVEPAVSQEDLPAETVEQIQQDVNHLIEVINNPAYVGYSSREEQMACMGNALIPEIVYEFDSILDVGCGLGDLYAYISEIKGASFVDYYGIDYNTNIINLGKQKFNNIADRLTAIDFLEYDVNNHKDWVIAVGAFNYQLKDINGADINMDEYIQVIIDRMMAVANKGASICALSKYSIHKFDESLYTYDPGKLLNYALDGYKNAVIYHNYMDGDFCLHIYK